MKKIFLFLLIIQTFALEASPSLKVGDVILQPLKCWTCSLIEAEEDTIYSHIGIVLQTRPEILVAEAFGKVELKKLADYAAKTEPGQRMKVIRFQNEKLVGEFTKSTQRLNTIFKTDFENKQYDHDFRWNNFDQNGDEKFYCSEFVSKIIQAFVGVETPIKRMHFKKNRDHWVKYFKGNVPDGEWGNSPGDFERSELFYEVGEL